ncbi:MAG: hypothetical protein LBJ36_02585 [Synergistaceae bacterium]|nr:hypothetical protein [Synergistaceae bacterium]
MVSSDNISRFSLPGDVAVKGVTASGEVLLKEMPGSGRRSELALAPKSLDVLVKIGHKLGKLFIYVYVDNGAKTSARVKLSGLANLSYKRPLNLAFSKSVRFTLANEDETPATLKQLSISVTFT